MFQAPPKIGPYTLIRRLGEGGFGEVWLADNPQDLLYQKVALKLAKNSNITLDMIKSEARLWRSISGNENIIPFIEAKNYDGQIVIVSEFAEGGSLEDHLQKNGGKLTLQEAEVILQDILMGLEHLHHKGIGHFDLKPANILIKEGKFCLADFGLSKVLLTENTSKGGGTLFYSAPELFDKKRSLQSDIWSVGVILQEMLTGKLPFEKGSPQAVMFSILIHEPRPLPNGIPPFYRNLVARCLEKNPKFRFQSAAEMRKDLEEFSKTFRQQSELITFFPDNAKSALTIERNQLEIGGEEKSFLPELSMIPYRKGNKWGFCDAQKNLIIPLRYTGAYRFSEGLAGVILNGKWGFIDQTGKEITPLKYDNVSTFSEGLALIRLKGKCGFIDKTGKEITPLKYDYDSFRLSSIFSEGLAAVRFKGKCGFVDKTGTETVPFIYHYTSDFSEGLARVELNGKWGFIDKTGKEIIPLIYEYVSDFSEGLAKVILNQKGGFIDKTGKEIIPPKYDPDHYDRSALTPDHSFSEGLAAVKSNGRWGFIDKTGKEKIPLIYDFADCFSEGLARIELNNKWGFINQKGKEIARCKYDNVSTFSEGLVAVKLNDKYGFIDKTGKEKIPLIYDFANSFSEGLALVRLNNKWFYIDKNGTEYYEP